VITWRKGVDPKALNPAFLADVVSVLDPSPYRWLVTYGRRTTAEQAALYATYQAGGPRAAPPGKSPHEFGLAIDVCLDGDTATVEIEPDWNTSHPGWLWLFEAIWQHPRLHSGRSFQDACHVERLGWPNFITPSANSAQSKSHES
jgi:hypothetical protein